MDSHATTDRVSSNADSSVDESVDTTVLLNEAAEAIVTLRTSVTASQRELGGKRVVVLHDEESGKFFQLGVEESAVVALLDGRSDLDLIASHLEKAGVLWSDDDLRAFTGLLIKSGLATVVRLNGQEPRSDSAREPSPPRSAIQTTALALGRLISQRIPLGNADRLAAILLPSLRHAYSSKGFVVWLAAIASAGWVAIGLHAEIIHQCKQMFSPGAWPLLAGIGMLVKVLHELGHATIAKRHGVRIGSVGITLFMFAPIAYVDVTNAWKLNSRWARIQIALGGVYLESWLAIFATFAFAWMDDGLARHLMAQIMLIAGPATWLINANPLLRLDGYYALADAADIPNLRMHGRKRWTVFINHWLLGLPYQESMLVGWRRHFAMLHAVASVAFQFVWMGGMLWAVWNWANIAGVILTVVALVAWVLIPIVAWSLQHWTANADKPAVAKVTRRRMTAFAALVSLLFSTILSARNPFAVAVPVIVQHHGEQIARASTDGFVTAVLVRGNQYVCQGDPLIEVTDEQLLLQRQQMSDEFASNLTKYRQLQSLGRLAEAEAANETAKQLRLSLKELDYQINASRITAMRDGVVVSEQPEQWLGRYAKRGDILIRIAEPNDKELLVAIQEGDFSAFKQTVQLGQPLEVRIRGGTRLLVEPRAAQPRFSTTLPHPALAATVGGDVPVSPDPTSSEGVKAATPMGAAIAFIPPAQSLAVRAGQRGVLYLDDDQRVYDRLKEILLGKK
jgi:putative peptide zinc metalloprotease protein